MTFSYLSVAKPTREESLHKFLQRPLIIGASVSGNFLADSPGKILAASYTRSENIKVIAKPGKSATEVLSQFSGSAVNDRTAVIGVDLFFWDSFAAAPAESLKVMETLTTLCADKHIPLIMGEVPMLNPQMQRSFSAINGKMKELCRTNHHCHILPLNEILHRVISDGYLFHKGRKYTLSMLMPDGLHIATAASEFLADQIGNLLADDVDN